MLSLGMPPSETPATRRACDGFFTDVSCWRRLPLRRQNGILLVWRHGSWLLRSDCLLCCCLSANEQSDRAHQGSLFRFALHRGNRVQGYQTQATGGGVLRHRYVSANEQAIRRGSKRQTRPYPFAAEPRNTPPPKLSRPVRVHSRRRHTCLRPASHPLFSFVALLDSAQAPTMGSPELMT